MKTNIIILEDEQVQARSIAKSIQRQEPNFDVEYAWEDEDMHHKVENIYYHIAIVDMQMDKFKETDGPVLIRKILKVNPLAKIIIVSGYLGAYDKQTTEFLKTGRILAMLDKGMEDREYNAEILRIIKDEMTEQAQTSDFRINTLIATFYDAKNEPDNYQKGIKFENFVATLFGQIGFKNIQKRVIDKSQNEVDLIIRNEIEDLFFQKFKPYILVECKNEKEKVDKNAFIQFYTKLENTNSLSNLGFLLTSSAGMKETVYKEAMRTSKGASKVIFITQIEIMRLIQSTNMLATLKNIIDEQVKDN